MILSGGGGRTGLYKASRSLSPSGNTQGEDLGDRRLCLHWECWGDKSLVLLFAGERFWTVQNTSIRGGGQGLRSAMFMLATRTKMRKHMLLHSCPVCVCVCAGP